MIPAVIYPAIQEPTPLPESQRPEASHPDAWMQQVVEPVRVDPRVAFREGLYEPDRARLLDPEFPSMDKWWSPASEPVRTPPHVVREGVQLTDPARLLDPETTTIDRYYVQDVTPFHPPRYPEGWSILEFVEAAAPPEDITLDKWYSPPSQPLFQLPRAVDEGAQLSDPARLLDMEFPFHVATSYHPDVHLTPRWPVHEGVQLSDVARLTDAEFTFVTWWTQTDEPVRVAARLLANGLWVIDEKWIAPVPPETITLDKWYVQPSEPVRVRPHLLANGLVVISDIALVGVAARMDWWQPASEPVRTFVWPVAEGVFILWPLPLPTKIRHGSPQHLIRPGSRLFTADERTRSPGSRADGTQPGRLSPPGGRM